ncbi:coiled-coil domain-containing protein [Lignipirellula cremea]|uniref:Chromosome partition protein Smc n=1 Tax=Lignipirellula cremea TaxID=2528010 RepID=A0A518E3T1_9BACT|nr:hypothetical protein [Lignipirellula cremea]QDU98756.1 hypothetical protein Pla8534_66290 [Lignipirellula cremea]
MPHAMPRFLANPWLLAVSVCLLASPAFGQPAESGSPRTSLGVRQQRVEHMLLEMELKFKSLAQTLQESEPERADKLVGALQESKKLLLADRMANITAMLNEARLDSATTEQKKILSDLRSLIRLLLEDDQKNPLQEWEQLQVWRGQLEDIQNEQKATRRESDKRLHPDSALRDLDAQIAAVEALLEKQQKLNTLTETARQAGPQQLTPLTPQQDALRQQTDDVAAQIAAAGANREGAPPVVMPAPSTDPPAASDPPEPGQTEPPQPEPGQPATGPSESGQQALQNASQHQQSAAAGLQQGQGAIAGDGQKKATEELERALAELRGERGRIAMLPPQSLPELAEQQAETADKTARLKDEMQQRGAGGSSPGGGSMPPGGKKPPGQKHVEQAQQAMEKAASDLRSDQGEQAADEQEQALRELEKAIAEIEKRLAQLREETQVERLARLEQRFREMLARQQAATAKTAEMEKLLLEAGSLKRSDRLLIVGLAKEERALAESAFQAYDILIEDGASVVFPSIVNALRVDLEQTAALLDGLKTDDYTQAVQEEIETTLAELISALEKAQRQKKSDQESSSGGGEQQQPPLLPNSAELKLLMSAQMRINRLTRALEKVRGDAPLDEASRLTAESIAARQEEVANLTERILQRIQPPTP